MPSYTHSILSALAGREVAPGDIVTVEVARVMAHDGTGPVLSRTLDEHGIDQLAAADRTVFIFDHYYPPSTPREAMLQATAREFAARHGIPVYAGHGIAHQVIAEKALATPGTMFVGGDSHTCTAGALGAFAMGVGATDVAAVVASGRVWMETPEALRIRLVGALAPPATAHDLALTIVGRVGMQGGLGKTLEFVGPAVGSLSISDRLKISNYAVEMGAIAGIFGVDDTTRAWIDARGGSLAYADRVVHDDRGEGAQIEIDLSAVTPTVALPSRPDQVAALEALDQTVPVQQVFLGSCAGGRIDDLRAAAAILRGKRVADGVRLLVGPASAEVAAEAMQTGILGDLLAAGATILPPGCGACLGWIGTLGEGEVEVSTQNRNFVGRAGAASSRIYLASPETAARVALSGVLEGAEQP
ncbi:3-isopropylmalate dehydratase large subunit [Haliangium sp.]|uniref:3-isopropylmalate dehydratase large subunit n=1 Tax=Haliangium sp. TaxID=2663208 RepID=UPI003D112E6F